jgi:arylsulfatase A-like enzyme
MQWKGRVPAGTEYHKPIIQLDILPTALGAAGVKARPAWKLDGVNLLDYVGRSRRDAPHDVLYWRFGDLLALRSDDWKVVRTWDNTSPQLFNLAKDLGEKNQAAYRDARRAAFSQSIARLQQGTAAAAITLLKAMIDSNTPASVKVRAAEAIFNHAAKAIEIEDIEARVSELERAAEASKPAHSRNR